MAKRFSPPRPPAAPPANAEEGAGRVSAAVVPIFDKGDGHGADWRMACLSLILAGLRLLEKLPEDDRRKIAERVNERVYPYMRPGPLEEDAVASNSGPAGSVSAPSNTAVFKSTAPRPPKVGH